MGKEPGVTKIEDVLAYFGVTDTTLSEAEKAALDEKGYLIFPGLIDKTWIDQLRVTVARLLEEEGSNAGIEFNQEEGAARLSDLANKGAIFDGCYTHPKVLAAAYYIIGREFKVTSINARDALPGKGHQALHADWGPREPGEPYHIVNSIWLLDPMTKANGATRLVPGTHRLPGRPADYISDTGAPHPEQILLEGPAGTVLVYNAHLWHGGTRNSSSLPRRVLHPAYIAREFPQQLDQAKYIRKSTLERISPAARYLLDV